MSLSDNLIAYWSLSDTSDAHGSNTLTNNGGATFTTGKVGNGVDLENSSSQYLSIADNAALSMGDIDFTLACWVKLESTTGGVRVILSKDNVTGQREYLLYSASSRFNFAVSANGTSLATLVQANNLGEPAIDTWYYIVAWHNSVANTLNIQVNNGTVDSVAHSTGVIDSTAPFRIGAHHATPGNFLDGIVDEVAIWKRVLTSDERTDLYNGGSGRDYAYIAGGSGPTYTLDAAGGSYSVTGTAATLKASRKLSAGIGGYSLTGTAAALKAARKMAADGGSYTLSGTDATLTYNEITGPQVVTGHTKGATAGNVTSVDVTTPTHAEGDVIYIAIMQDALAELTEPAGFSVLYDDIDLSGTGGETFDVYYKTAGASEPASYTVSSDVSERFAWIAWAVTSDGGIDVSGTPGTGSSASATVPNITTTEDDTLVMVVVASDGDSTPHGTISGYTKLDEITGSSAGTVSVQYKLKSAAGAENGNAVSITTEQWGAVAWAIAFAAPAATYTLDADGGSYSLTGTAASLKAARKLSALGGSYTLTGTAADLTRTRKLSALAGSFTLTGTPANLVRARKLVATGGSYTLTGTAASLKASRKLTAGAGSYVLTGTDASLQSFTAESLLTPAERTLVIAYENRTYAIPFEDRTYAIEE